MLSGVLSKHGKVVLLLVRRRGREVCRFRKISSGFFRKSIQSCPMYEKGLRQSGSRVAPASCVLYISFRTGNGMTNEMDGRRVRGRIVQLAVWVGGCRGGIMGVEGDTPYLIRR